MSNEKERADLIDHVNKRDLEIILEVNKRAIEVGIEATNQNEEIIRQLESGKTERAELLKNTEEVADGIEEITRDLFKIKILYVGSLIALAGRIISMFIRH